MAVDTLFDYIFIFYFSSHFYDPQIIAFERTHLTQMKMFKMRWTWTIMYATRYDACSAAS